jgi:hypothetical protein
MKLRLHGTPAECAAAPQRRRRTPASTSKTRAAPTQTAAASWSAPSLTVHLNPAPARGRGAADDRA